MAPELLVTMEAEELRGHANFIREWQIARGLSDNALVKKLPQVGSTKTFKRILEDDLAELDLERQLANYRAARAFVETLGDEAERGADELFDDLTPVLALRRAFVDTSRETSDGRVIFLLGPTGSGKSSARRVLADKFGSRLLLIEASVAWNDSPMAMLGAILDALGKKEKPSQQVERLEKAIGELKETRRCLLVEEGHHLGPRCLNLIKTLVNHTPGEYVIIGIDTLWRRLETKAFEEARQLTGNRLAERITLPRELQERDVRLILNRRLGITFNKDWIGALSVLLDKSTSYGRFAFVREVVRRIREKCEDRSVAPEDMITAISEEVSSR